MVACRFGGASEENVIGVERLVSGWRERKRKAQRECARRTGESRELVSFISALLLLALRSVSAMTRVVKTGLRPLQ